MSDETIVEINEYHRQHLKNRNGSRVEDCPECQETYGPDAI
jgi:hypothetical protein